MSIPRNEPPRLTRGEAGSSPTRQGLDAKLAAESLEPRWWSNGPGDRYGVHEHGYHKVLYCASGSITFELPDHGESYAMEPGDRLDLPPGTRHGAVVGPEGVSCVEGWREVGG